MKNLILVITACIISAASVLYTQSQPLPPPFFGYDPDTAICVQGTIEQSGCGFGNQIRCTVQIGPYNGILAYDVRIAQGTLCHLPVFTSLPAAE